VRGRGEPDSGGREGADPGERGDPDPGGREGTDPGGRGDPDPLLRAEGLDFRYPAASRRAVHDVSLGVRAGRLQAVIGPNGSGKSTLLKLLLGVLAADAGQVSYRGRPLESWERAELARRVGVVPQREEVTFPLTVREYAGMGRYPHLGPWRTVREEDRRAVDRALERCDLASLAGRAFDTLSGGERQLARVARALAQEPELLVLDEPTASLDLRHRMEIFLLLRDLVREDGAAVLLVTHDLNGAARTADRLLLLAEGEVAAEGPPRDVLTRERVERVYGWPVHVAGHPGPGPERGAPQIVPLARPSTPDTNHDTGKDSR